MTTTIEHFAKLDKFSQKALAILEITGILDDSKTFDGKIFEKRLTMEHVFDQYAQAKIDPEYEDYFHDAYDHVKDEIERNFNDNNVDKREYVDRFNERIGRVIEQLRARTGLNYLEYHLIEFDVELHQYPENDEIMRYMFFVTAWMGPLERLQIYMNARSVPNTSNGTAAGSTESTASVWAEDLRSLIESPTASEKLLSTKELCFFLNISKPKVLKWRAKGRIPFLKFGSVYRYDKAAVIQALSEPKKRGLQVDYPF